MRSERKGKSIFFIVPYPQGEAPGQRFRFEQYFSILEQSGFQFKVASFLDSETNQILYKQGFTGRKILGVAKGFLRRILHLFIIPRYDYVFIFREAAPVGPPFFEWIIARILRKKIIYDFDDAIWLPNTSEENKLVARLKWHGKVADICKWSYIVSCGNPFLGSFARQLNSRVIMNPTTIDTEFLHNPELYPRPPLPSAISEQQLVIGWTGSHSTLIYLNLILPVLQELEKKYRFTFLVIADRKPDINLRSLQFTRWNKETEIQDLAAMDVGLMPLNDDQWAQGKCGFKALQYMAMGIPALASPVGVNNQIIEDGVDGFLCNSHEGWYQKIEILIRQADLRKTLGEKGRAKVISNYSVLSNRQNFLRLFE